MNPLAPRDALALVLGPAWAASTPRTDEEASVILGATEPRHALRERMHHRMQRTLGNVVLEPSPRVTPGEPMPEATMPAAEWRATWRDAEVPVLCELRERCEATGARIVLPLDGLDAPESVYYRYTSRDGMLGGALWKVRPARSGSTIDDLCRVGEGGEGGEHVPLDAERVYPGDSTNARAYPLPWADRGWCEGLWVGTYADTRSGTPATAAATWQAMRDACPERVYPEPSQT